MSLWRLICEIYEKFLVCDFETAISEFLRPTYTYQQQTVSPTMGRIGIVLFK